MKESNNKKSTELKNIMEFYAVSNEYCAFIEKAEKNTKDHILNVIQKLGPLLYLKASMLPSIILEEDIINPRYVTEELWEEIFNSLKNKIGSDDSYWKLENYADTPVKASLSDNLTDIYQDLKDFTIQIQSPYNHIRDNAVMDCKHLFADHWGPRILNVLNIVHTLLYEKEIQLDDIQIDDADLGDLVI